jgi:hypothetical protein
MINTDGPALLKSVEIPQNTSRFTPAAQGNFHGLTKKLSFLEDGSLFFFFKGSLPRNRRERLGDRFGLSFLAFSPIGRAAGGCFSRMDGEGFTRDGRQNSRL